MYKMLFTVENFERFQAPWGAWAALTPYNDGFTIPLGWEEELTKRGIEFTVIDLVEEREAIIEDLVEAAIAFGLGDFIKDFFFENRLVIQEYQKNGGDELKELFETAEDSELDLTNEDGISPRIYALELLR